MHLLEIGLTVRFGGLQIMPRVFQAIRLNYHRQVISTRGVISNRVDGLSPRLVGVRASILLRLVASFTMVFISQRGSLVLVIVLMDWLIERAIWQVLSDRVPEQTVRFVKVSDYIVMKIIDLANAVEEEIFMSSVKCAGATAADGLLVRAG